MPRLIIDEREVEVPAGTKVIEAAERLGIMIPRFCFHPALGAVGACRVCAVKFVQGPFKGVQMSCMIEARDGMVVSTTDEEAVAFRRRVIEWLMLHHPHDCPVCDEGGHCLLQDMTVSCGHGNRQYPGLKRTYRDQYLGPLVQHEMNRCIHCYRCTRFYREFAGYHDLGVLQIANRTYFGRAAPGVLESPFTGNLSDICPTGVYTDRPSRYKGRRWDYERTPAVCIHCSLGCHTVVDVRYREIVRLEARYSPVVNGHFICDRGRFGFYYGGHPRRPRQARIDGRPAALGDGLGEAARRLDAVAGGGSASVACLGGVRSSLETQAALDRLCRARGWRPPVFFSDAGVGARTAAAAGCLTPEVAVSLRQIEEADAVLAVGTDPLNEAPMLALAIRQAWRRGAAVAVIDPRPVSLPMDFSLLATAPDALAGILARLCREGTAPPGNGAPPASAAPGRPGPPASEGTGARTGPPPEALARVARRLNASRRPVIVCGTSIDCAGLPRAAADAARRLKTAERTPGLFYVMPGAGAFSAGLLNPGGVDGILTAIENGAVRALVTVESDVLQDYPDRRRVTRALERLELLVALDCVESEATRRAHILLPTATIYEAGGHTVNQEGRVQVSAAACRGGASIDRVGGGSHPPRRFGADIPASEQLPAWQALAALTPGGGVFEPLAYLSGTLPAFTALAAGGGIPEEGRRLPPGPTPPAQTGPHPHPPPGGRPAGGLQLVLTDRVFGTEPLSAWSDCLEEVTPPPVAWLHPDDAGRLGLADGDDVTIETGSGRLTLGLRRAAAMAPGILVLPRHRGVRWQIFESGAARIPPGAITPAGGGGPAKG